MHGGGLNHKAFVQKWLDKKDEKNEPIYEAIDKGDYTEIWKVLK